MQGTRPRRPSSAEAGCGAPGLPYYDVVARWTVEAGLCEACRWRRDVRGAASTFVMCTRGLTDPAFAKYPVLPVRQCRGYAPAAGDGGGEGDET